LIARWDTRSCRRDAVALGRNPGPRTGGARWRRRFSGICQQLPVESGGNFWRCSPELRRDQRPIRGGQQTGRADQRRRGWHAARPASRHGRALAKRGRLRLEFVSGFTAAIGQKFLIVAANPRLLTFRSDFDVVGLPVGMKVRLNCLREGVEAEILLAP